MYCIFFFFLIKNSTPKTDADLNGKPMWAINQLPVVNTCTGYTFQLKPNLHTDLSWFLQAFKLNVVEKAINRPAVHMLYVDKCATLWSSMVLYTAGLKETYFCTYMLFATVIWTTISWLMLQLVELLDVLILYGINFHLLCLAHINIIFTICE